MRAPRLLADAWFAHVDNERVFAGQWFELADKWFVLGDEKCVLGDKWFELGDAW